MSDLDPKALEPNEPARTLRLEHVTSAALARLIEEVRNTGGGKAGEVTAYHRTYHRHNR